jgi:hypothetical protein
MGTAIFAVVLSDQARAALGPGTGRSGGLIQTLSPAVRTHVAGPLASAFGNAFWWALAATLVALIPASVLAATQRRQQRRAVDGRPTGGGLSLPSVPARRGLTRSSARPAPRPASATRSGRRSIRGKRPDTHATNT